MERIKILKQKSIETLKRDGVVILAKKGINYIKKNRNVQRNSDANKFYGDVLFIDGCFLTQTHRYRITHQREQLDAAGISSSEVFYEDLSLDLVKNYRVFIFFRCPITDVVEKFIKIAKKHNKTVIFDIDDLVIDRKYTDTIKYLKTMSEEEKRSYDEGVDRIQKTLRMCDSAITTTERLAIELKKYVSDVYINRNTASNEMVHISQLAQQKKKQSDKIRIGYFSGSITHNDDIIMILPVIVKILKENINVELHFVGELEIPKELDEFKERIIINPFVDWKRLPELISNVDINLVPLESSIFNEAKSEIKWIEASLVKVVTVASRIGALDKMISNNNTGFLCSNNVEWYDTLTKLINDEKLRVDVSKKAYEYVYNNCTTIYTAYSFGKYIKSKMKKNIAFVLPSTQISGGVLVVLKHCLILQKSGYDVLIINDGFENKNVKFENEEIFCISKHNIDFRGSIDKCVATLWSTLEFVESYSRIKEKFYLVQNFETNFYEDGSYFKVKANSTYCYDDKINYITISKWCEKWLKESYGKECKYAPNGLEISRFTPIKRDFNKDKIRILVEGNCDDYYKNVDESFKIIEKLDKSKYEVWYMSYQGTPKKFYYVDKFLHRVPNEEVANIYRQCDILIKSSILESFSYPPIEMMATGGYVVVAQNYGNVEYLINEKNCLLYNQGDIEFAANCVERIVNEEVLRKNLMINGINTAQNREWSLISDKVLQLYEGKERG